MINFLIKGGMLLSRTVSALGLKGKALGVKRPLGVAENPFPELPFFTK